MAAAAFSAPFQDVALAAATAKSIVALTPASNKPVTLTEIALSFDGVTAGNTPVLVEIMKGDSTGNGTFTSVTPVQTRGPLSTAQTTAGKTATAEPTNLTQAKCFRITPAGGLFIMPLPLGREVEGQNATGGWKQIVVRLTAAQIVNVTGWLEFEE